MKAIEEAAIIAASNYDNPFDEPAYDKKFYDGFLAGANHVMSLPLADRLTDEEREKIKAESEGVVSTKTKAMLMRIFGKEMFE